MGGNYEKGMYNQLMEVMACLDVMEDSLCKEKREHKTYRKWQEDSGKKADMKCSIMTMIETLKKRNMGMIENIKKS